MTDKPDPAAVEAAVKRLRLWIESWSTVESPVTEAAKVLLASHAALKAGRDEALVEVYARATPIGAVQLPVKRGGQS